MSTIPSPPPPPQGQRRSRWLLLLVAGLVIAVASGFTGYWLGQTEDEPVVAATADEPVAAAAGDDVEAAPMHTPEPATAKTSRKATKPPVAEAETSDRGLLVKEIGEVAGLGDSPVEAMAEFTVDSIEVAGACTSEIAEEPENGYFVMVTITATVQPGFAEWFEAESGWAGGMPFDTYSFGLIDADGVVVNAPDTWGALSCLADADMMPDEVTDGKTATGTVVLDSPTPSGVVTFQPTGVEGGWEWEF